MYLLDSVNTHKISGKIKLKVSDTRGPSIFNILKQAVGSEIAIQDAGHPRGASSARRTPREKLLLYYKAFEIHYHLDKEHLLLKQIHTRN